MTVCSICQKEVTLDNPILHENGVAKHIKCRLAAAPTVLHSTSAEPRVISRDIPDPMPFWKR